MTINTRQVCETCLVSRESHPVPTLSEWGMLILVGLLAGYGVWTLRRRSLRPLAQ